MVWLMVILLVLTILMAYLLFAPFSLQVDSVKGIFRFRFHKLARGILLIRDNTLLLSLKIAGWQKDIDLLKKRAGKKPGASKKEPQKRKVQFPFRKAIRVLNSFKIKQFFITISWPHMHLNGILYPVTIWLSSISGKTISTNFQNENIIVLEIENNIARMLWAFLKA
jgi:hypothetical protein